MSAAAVQEYARFFKVFIEVCLLPGWPDNNKEPEYIRNVFDIGRHVEKSIRKMKNERNCFDMFIDLLSTNRNFTKVFLQNCMTDPPKFILRKIINSECDINEIDIAFQTFKHLFSEDRLVQCLSDLMVEAASKETLLKNMSTVLPQQEVQDLKNQLYLFLILECDSEETVVNVLKDCNQQMIDTLVLCLVKGDHMIGLQNDDLSLVKRKIITGFTNIMSCRDSSAKPFWELLFNTEKENLIEMCLKYNSLCEMAFEALKDSYIQVMNNLLSESFYINFTESQLYSTLAKIFECGTLKFKFVDYMKDYSFDESCLQNLPVVETLHQ